MLLNLTSTLSTLSLQQEPHVDLTVSVTRSKYFQKCCFRDVGSSFSSLLYLNQEVSWFLNLFPELWVRAIPGRWLSSLKWFSGSYIYLFILFFPPGLSRLKEGTLILMSQKDLRDVFMSPGCCPFNGDLGVSNLTASIVDLPVSFLCCSPELYSNLIPYYSIFFQSSVFQTWPL